MDIYLINSGHCDFYDPSPPLHNALYHNNRDRSFTDVTQKTWRFWHFVLDETDHGFTMTAS